MENATGGRHPRQRRPDSRRCSCSQESANGRCVQICGRLDRLRRLRPGGGGPLLGAGDSGPGVSRRPDHVRARASRDLAPAVDRPCGRGADRRDPGVHVLRARRLRRLSPDGHPGRRPSHLSVEHPRQDPRRSRREVRRVGREAGKDPGADPGRPRLAKAHAGDGGAADGRHHRAGRGILFVHLAGAGPRAARHRRLRGRAGALHAARSRGPARPAARAVRSWPAGGHDQGDR